MATVTYYASLSSPTSIYTLLYVTVMTCFALRTKEFVSAGFVIESIFDYFLQKEHEGFIQYHIRRTSLTFLIHSLIPIGYFFGLAIVSDDIITASSLQGLWLSSILLISIILPTYAAFLVFSYFYSDWDDHPIARRLCLFCTDGASWKELASVINSEYRGIDKINLETSSLTRLVITDTWIIKLSSYKLEFAHQSDSSLIVCGADTHQMSMDGEGTVQYVNILVKTLRPGVPSFYIRCNALEFNDIKNKIQRPIHILEGISFHKNRIDHFLEVFRETVENNPVFALSPFQELDTCIGCMLSEPQVKLVKNCRNGQCTTCHCRPLWCLDCMAKWFASRQDQDRPDTWLSSTCTCPICRSVFCVLDVCLVQK